MNDPRRYEIVFSGKHEDKTYKHYKTEIVVAHDLNSARLKLQRDYIDINIHFEGIAL